MCRGQTGSCSKWGREPRVGMESGRISLHEERAAFHILGRVGLRETTLKVAWFCDQL